jgi:hypothetical protein
VRSEIESLNLDDMDVEELERRIELGPMMPMPGAQFSCGQFSCDHYLHPAE